jgi:hypothetical protein
MLKGIETGSQRHDTRFLFLLFVVIHFPFTLASSSSFHLFINLPPTSP